jgi:hypothetical protein
MYLVGFTIGIYYDARTYERQIWEQFEHSVCYGIFRGGVYVTKPSDEFRHAVGFRCIPLCDCTAFRFGALSFMVCGLCNGVWLLSL